MSLVACAQGEGGWKQKHYRLEVETERLQPVDEKIKNCFARKYFFHHKQTAKFLEALPRTPSSGAGIAVPDARARLHLASALD